MRNIIFFRIKNPYIHSGWITNPAERESVMGFSYEKIDEAIVEELIKESYQLIASKLPKAIRSKYLSVLN